MNKIKISPPKISLINNIGTPPNSTRKYILSIAHSGANTHLANQDTPTMATVFMSKDTASRLPDRITMDSSHKAILQLPGQRKKLDKFTLSQK